MIALDLTDHSGIVFVDPESIAAVMDINPDAPDWNARVILKTGQAFDVKFCAEEIRRLIDGSEPIGE